MFSYAAAAAERVSRGAVCIFSQRDRWSMIIFLCYPTLYDSRLHVAMRASATRFPCITQRSISAEAKRSRSREWLQKLYFEIPVPAGMISAIPRKLTGFFLRINGRQYGLLSRQEPKS